MRSLKRRNRNWPLERTVAWVAGWALVLVATSGGLGVYSPVLFSAHMAQHMILNMVVPILLVLGDPITLALQSIPSRDNERGPREWVVAAVRGRVFRFLTNPLVAAGIFALSLWILFFTGLFEIAMKNHFGHSLMQAHFVLSGFLFFYVLIGRDMTARRFPYPARLGLLMIVMVSHSFFGLAVSSGHSVIAQGYYASLGRTWGASALSDQHTGGTIAWAFGEFPITIILGILLLRWIKSDEREAENWPAREQIKEDSQRHTAMGGG